MELYLGLRSEDGTFEVPRRRLRSEIPVQPGQPPLQVKTLPNLLSFLLHVLLCLSLSSLSLSLSVSVFVCLSLSYCIFVFWW